MTPTRVLLVDDSEIALATIGRIVASIPDVEVVGTARDVRATVEFLDHRSVDVVVMDLVMPENSGFAAIQTLKARVGIVAVSGFAPDSELARESIARGAAAYVSKLELRDRTGIAALAGAIRRASTARTQKRSIVAIGGSTGAPEVAAEIVTHLRGLPVSVVVVQHLPPNRVEAFAQRLGQSGLRSKVASDGEQLASESIYVSPGDRHLRLVRPGRVSLGDEPPVHGHRPSVTHLMRSLVPFGPSVFAIVLSGMGDDGAEPIADLVAAGASVVAQLPKSCAVSGMPDAALLASRSVRALTPTEIGVAARWFVEAHVSVP